MINTLVFDFDGTLADTFFLIPEIYQVVAIEFGFKSFDSNQIQLLRHKGFAQLVKELKIPIYKLPKLAKRIQEEIGKKMPEARFFQSIPSILQNLKKQNYTLGVLSSNSRKNVMQFLTRTQTRPLFDFVYTGRSILGKDKVLKRMLKSQKLAKQQVLYFGDEVRDIVACKKVGLKVAAVSWGFNSYKILASNKPDYLIKKPTEILNLMRRLSLKHRV